MRIINVVGARPNFMKIAPLMAAMKQAPAIEPLLVHTGQHYDAAMSQTFFDELGIPQPDLNLGVGSGSHAAQTAHVMVQFEEVLLERQPDLVLVVGDVNSTLACSVTAAKLDIPVAHVEAGLRSFDRRMPEEINRIVTDALSDLLFTTCDEANQHLAREGIAQEKIFLVGNVMIDTLVRHVEQAQRSTVRERLSLGGEPYALVTLHRPSNVDELEALTEILTALEAIEHNLTIVFPVHPRTRVRFTEFGLGPRLAAMKRLKLIEPLGYLDFLHLMACAKLVLTDSGGIQEETTYLQVPCLTLRENTERGVTITHGTNHLVGMKSRAIIDGAARALAERSPTRRVPPLWDGHAAERIVSILVRKSNELKKHALR